MLRTKISLTQSLNTADPNDFPEASLDHPWNYSFGKCRPGKEVNLHNLFINIKFGVQKPRSTRYTSIIYKDVNASGRTIQVLCLQGPRQTAGRSSRR